jgi:two-component system phosphate regulon sensor histidine kinase PhoR
MIRVTATAALAAGGLALALWLGAPLPAALLALAVGALAAAILRPRAPDDPASPAARPHPVPPDLTELLQAMDEPMLVVRARQVIAANAAARALLGAHIEDADVRLAIRHPAAAETLTGDDEGETGESARTELIGLGDDAGRPWEMTVTRLPDSSRLVRLSDLSQQRAAERMRTDFVANASHELRTPLATLLGFIETLQDPDAGGDAATRARFLGIMMDEATRMRALVEDLMSLSRIEADRFAPPTEEIDLVPLIEEVKGALVQLAESRESRVEIERGTMATIVRGDRAQLAQMFANLVTNALKYGRAGTPVRVRVEDGGDALLRVSVIDEGEGIAPEHLPRLTERFYRVDTGRSRAAGGTGLGLAIVKHIVLRHRGRLDIRSTPGVGTEARVSLPHATKAPSSKSHGPVTQGTPSGPSSSP